MREAKRCSDCNGRAVFAWFDGLLLFFSRALDPTSITLARYQSFIRGALNGVLVLYGLCGFLFFAFATIGILPRTSGVAFLFWSSLLLDLFAYRRLVHDTEEYAEIPLHRYGETTIAGVAPRDWSSLKSIEKKNHFDIARAFTPEAHKAVRRAVQIADRLHHARVKPLHLFASLKRKFDVLSE